MEFFFPRTTNHNHFFVSGQWSSTFFTTLWSRFQFPEPWLQTIDWMWGFFVVSLFPWKDKARLWSLTNRALRKKDLHKCRIYNYPGFVGSLFSVFFLIWPDNGTFGQFVVRWCFKLHLFTVSFYFFHSSTEISKVVACGWQKKKSVYLYQQHAIYQARSPSYFPDKQEFNAVEEERAERFRR